MDEPRNRGSPRLQFTKEELEDSTLSKPIAKAEKAADKYEKAKGKLKKRYQLKLSREEMEASKAPEELGRKKTVMLPLLQTLPIHSNQTGRYGQIPTRLG